MITTGNAACCRFFCFVLFFSFRYLAIMAGDVAGGDYM